MNANETCGVAAVGNDVHATGLRAVGMTFQPIRDRR